MEREISKKVTGLGTSLAQVPFRACGRPHSGCWKRLKMSCFGCSRCPKHRLGLMSHRLWGTAGDCPQNLTLLLRSSSSGCRRVLGCSGPLPPCYTVLIARVLGWLADGQAHCPEGMVLEATCLPICHRELRNVESSFCCSRSNEHRAEDQKHIEIAIDSTQNFDNTTSFDFKPSYL